MISPRRAHLHYARRLLDAVGRADLDPIDAGPERTPAEEWARCGAMCLTGRRDGPPLTAPGPLATCARGALAALRALAPDAGLPEDGAALLGERAALLGLERNGSVSPGGSARLLACADGWLAVNLARPDDRRLLPAWLGCAGEGDPWPALERALAHRGLGAVVERARLLGLPVAPCAPPPACAPPWLRTQRRHAAGPPRPDPPRVADLSALWAGPLCGRLLAAAGADVIKVESLHRPDGARSGPAAFFDCLNAAKASAAFDLPTPDGVGSLRRLLGSCDVVIEASRPRALRQLGIDADAWLRARAGRVWVSITGYGRREPLGQRVAFGDDAAAAAGLTWRGRRPPLFCADAIADPLTGLHAALAALAAWRAGGGALLDLSLRDVAAHALCFPAPSHEAAPHPAEPPRACPPSRHAPPLGADTERLLAGCPPC